jgi:hypothetical protein
MVHQGIFFIYNIVRQPHSTILTGFWSSGVATRVKAFLISEVSEIPYGLQKLGQHEKKNVKE